MITSRHIEDLLPHRGPMSLLTRIVDWDGTSVRCAATIRSDHPFLVEGAAPAVVLLELMAQAAGVAASLADEDQRADSAITPTSGMIVRVAEMTVHVDQLCPGDKLVLHARRAASAHTLGVFQASAEKVERGGPQSIAAATLSIIRGAS